MPRYVAIQDFAVSFCVTASDLRLGLEWLELVSLMMMGFCLFVWLVLVGCLSCLLVLVRMGRGGLDGRKEGSVRGYVRGTGARGSLGVT